MPKIYYAHPLTLYGSAQEERDIQMLEELGFEVENPNSEHHARQYQLHGMGHFCDTVRKCDALAFRAFPDGRIPAGIAKEIRAAQLAKKPIIEFPCGITHREFDVEQTEEYLAQAGQRAPRY